MKRTIIVIIIGVGLAAGLWIAYQRGGLAWIGIEGPKPVDATTDGDADESASGEARQVAALGWIEPADGVIDLSALPGDRLQKLEVREGSAVEKGQPLAYLESRSLREHEKEAIASQLAEAKARRTAEERLADANITAATLAVEEAETLVLDIAAHRKKIGVLEAGLELAQNDLRRLKGLSNDLVSAQERERQALVVKKAEAELSAAVAMLEKLETSHRLSVKAAEAKLQAAEAAKQQVLSAIPVGSLQKRLDLAERQLEQTVIEAPSDGTVLKVFTQTGETIGRMPILQMGSLDRMVVVAEVYETDLKHVKPGQTAVIHSRAFPPPHDREGIRGKVARIGKIISKPEMKSLDPLARVDRHVAEVRIELDEEGSRQAANLANLQVDVTFLVEP